MNNITIPAFIFGSLVACLFGALIHLIFGGKPIRLILPIIFSWIGFWVGNNLGFKFGFLLLKYGPVNYGPAIIISFCLGLGGYWLSGENKQN